MITAVDDAGKPAGRDQAGLGMFSLIVSLALLGLLAAIAVIAIPSDPTKVPGITPTTHPGTSTTAAALAGQAAGNPFTAVPSTSAALISAVAAGGPTGGVTLAVRSTSGTCWLLWKSSTATWYGAETGQTSCAAPPLGNAPVAGAAGNGAISWHLGAFPAP